MTENNDMHINRFLHERKRELEDNGFSRRVMKKLPNREKKISNLWTLCCSILTFMLFFLLGGANLLLEMFRQILLSGSVTYLENTDPIPLITAAVILISLGVKRICSME